MRVRECIGEFGIVCLSTGITNNYLIVNRCGKCCGGNTDGFLHCNIWIRSPRTSTQAGDGFLELTDHNREKLGVVGHIFV